MKIAMKRTLYWTPRVLCVLFAGFVSLFALDVFSAGYGIRDTIIALLIHLVPTYLVVIATAISWRYELIGACLFMGLGVWYIVMVWGKFPWMTYAMISGPLFLVGGLFLLNRLYRDELRDAPQPAAPTNAGI